MFFILSNDSLDLHQDLSRLVEKKPVQEAVFLGQCFMVLAKHCFG